MKLIVLPDDGVTPLMKAIHRAKRRIDMVIFRFDRTDLEKALAAAVARGVVVRVLIAHTNGGGEKRLRKLEPRLLEAGVTVARTADDLPRYHGKMTVIDDELFVLGFNFTRQDIERSRSFGIIAREPKLLNEAEALFEADCTRQPYTPRHDQFVVSPDTSRQRISALIGSARKELLIYDARISDKLILRLLRERVEAGVEIRVIGKLAKPMAGVATRTLLGPAAARPGHRLRRRPGVHRQPEPAQDGTRPAPRDRRDRQGRAHRRQGAGGVRGRLGARQAAEGLRRRAGRRRRAATAAAPPSSTLVSA